MFHCKMGVYGLVWVAAMGNAFTCRLLYV